MTSVHLTPSHRPTETLRGTRVCVLGDFFRIFRNPVAPSGRHLGRWWHPPQWALRIVSRQPACSGPAAVHPGATVVDGARHGRVKTLTLNGSLLANNAARNPFNTREVHATEMPAANGITNTSSLAKMYDATVSGVDGVRLLSPEVMQAASDQAAVGPDAALVVETRFGMGFLLDNETVPLLGTNAFGHAGAGGLLG